MYNDKLKTFFVEKCINEVILTGMETQWCINSTVIDLTKNNIKVNVPVDAIGNNLRNSSNKYNLERLRYNGARLCTTNGILCEQIYHR